MSLPGPLAGFLQDRMKEIHYTVRILLGSSFLWWLLHNRQTTDSLWAIIALIVVTEPQVHPAWLAVRALFVNTLIGCSVALICLLLIGIHIWLMPVVLSLSAFISALVNRLQQGWKNAPTNSVIILSAAMTHRSAQLAFDTALHRAMEVMAGGLTALVVTRIVAFFWLPPEVASKATS